MRQPSGVVLFCIALTLPSLTPARTVFDHSATIQSYRVLSSIDFPGALTRVPQAGRKDLMFRNGWPSIAPFSF
jgi:hypothetical protein